MYVFNLPLSTIPQLSTIPSPQPEKDIVLNVLKGKRKSVEEIQHKLHKHFPSLPQNALRKIYKARCERLHLLMINGIPSDIRWLIEARSD